MPWGSEPGGLEGIRDELALHGTRVIAHEVDLAQPSAPHHLIDAVAGELGGLDILVANHTHSTMGDLDNLEAGEIDRHLIVNVRATMLLARFFVAQRQGERGGRIVFMISGQQLGPMPEELAYAASKGALVPLTTSLAAHVAPRGMTVNAVNPGATDTGWPSDEMREAVLARHPQGRWGRPEDAARVVCWLCTEEARWITGQIIDSNGGGP